MNNERIEKLLKKAQKITSENHVPGGRDYEREIYSKFAELIIRECITQCENVGEIAEQTNLGEMARKTKATTNGCAQMIKWRFGVE